MEEIDGIKVNAKKPLAITTDVDYNDLSLYGFRVEVEMDSGDVFISREGKEVLSVTKNKETKKVEVKRNIQGEMVFVGNDLLMEMDKYLELLKKEPIPYEEIDQFFYKHICNEGFKTDQIELLTYDLSTRKRFWQFFNQYSRLRFGETYTNPILVPEFLEIAEQIVEWDVEQDPYDEFMRAQFFAYTRQKVMQKKEKKEK